MDDSDIFVDLTFDAARSPTPSRSCPCGWRHWLRGEEFDFVATLRLSFFDRCRIGFNESDSLICCVRRFFARRGIPPNSPLAVQLITKLIPLLVRTFPEMEASVVSETTPLSAPPSAEEGLIPPNVETGESFDEQLYGAGRGALTRPGIESGPPEVAIDHTVVPVGSADGPCWCRHRHKVYTDEFDFAVAFNSAGGLALCGWNVGEDPCDVAIQHLFRRLNIDPQRHPEAVSSAVPLQNLPPPLSFSQISAQCEEVRKQLMAENERAKASIPADYFEHKATVAREAEQAMERRVAPKISKESAEQSELEKKERRLRREEHVSKKSAPTGKRAVLRGGEVVWESTGSTLAKKPAVLPEKQRLEEELFDLAKLIIAGTATQAQTARFLEVRSKMIGIEKKGATAKPPESHGNTLGDGAEEIEEPPSTLLETLAAVPPDPAPAPAASPAQPLFCVSSEHSPALAQVPSPQPASGPAAITLAPSAPVISFAVRFHTGDRAVIKANPSTTIQQVYNHCAWYMQDHGVTIPQFTLRTSPPNPKSLLAMSATVETESLAGLALQVTLPGK